MLFRKPLTRTRQSYDVINNSNSKKILRDILVSVWLLVFEPVYEESWYCYQLDGGAPDIPLSLLGRGPMQTSSGPTPLPGDAGYGRWVLRGTPRFGDCLWAAQGQESQKGLRDLPRLCFTTELWYIGGIEPRWPKKKHSFGLQEMCFLEVISRHGQGDGDTSHLFNTQLLWGGASHWVGWGKRHTKFNLSWWFWAL